MTCESIYVAFNLGKQLSLRKTFSVVVCTGLCVPVLMKSRFETAASKQGLKVMSAKSSNHNL